MLVYLLRHGQTSCTAGQLFCGDCPQRLTGKGTVMAAAAGQLLAGRAVRQVLSSPSPRAVQTGRVVAAQIGLDPGSVLVDDRLRETAFGTWEGLPPAAVARTQAYRRWVADPVLHAPPAGESGAEVLSRMLSFLAGAERSYGPGPVAVVSHKGPIRLALAHGLGVPLARYRSDVPAPVGSVSVVRVTDRLSVEETAGVDHLPLEMRCDPDRAA
jgi:probable phosphoglycerate mutase